MRELRILRKTTPRTDALISRYLMEISKTPLLSISEEIELARRVRAGDRIAFDKFVRSNLRFAFSVAKQYQNQGLDLPDLINEANSGLITAVERFDETKGFKFISYAVNWIRESIMRAIHEQTRIVRIPMNHHRTMQKIKSMQEYSLQTKGRTLSIDEMSEVSGCTEDVIRQSIFAFGSKATSLSRSFYDSDGENCLLDVLIDSDSLSPEKNLIDQSLRIEIESVLSTLKKNEELSIRMYYGIGHDAMTISEIAVFLKVEIPRVNQLILETKRKIKDTFRSNVLRTYLEFI